MRRSACSVDSYKPQRSTSRNSNIYHMNASVGTGRAYPTIQIVLWDTCTQEFYNCLQQGYGVAPKIWSFCTFEFLAVCKQGREEILRSEEMEKRKRKCCVETCKTITNQTGSNKAECTVNSRVQRNQILDVIPNPCL